MTTPLHWHRGDWMQTFTGRAFYPLAPRIEDITAVDIAHSLAMQCRYNGHVQRFYSVAEHCVLLHDWFLANPPEFADELPQGVATLALAALLHDAPEAYIGDMVRPLKRSMPDFCAVDDALTALIYEAFDLPFSKIPAAVKDADTRILLDERVALLGESPHSWNLDTQPLGVEIKAWSPDIAKWEYLSRLRALTS